jgi:hypothetical protein
VEKVNIISDGEDISTVNRNFWCFSSPMKRHQRRFQEKNKLEQTIYCKFDKNHKTLGSFNQH